MSWINLNQDIYKTRLLAELLVSSSGDLSYDILLFFTAQFLHYLERKQCPCMYTVCVCVCTQQKTYKPTKRHNFLEFKLMRKTGKEDLSLFPSLVIVTIESFALGIFTS